MARKLPKRREPSRSDDSSRGDAEAKAKPEVRASDLEGLKHFRKLRPLLKRLRKVGTQRDRAGNRDLHMDDYCVLVLIWLFNPILTSLRGLQQASQLPEVCEKFGIRGASLGSLSESVTLFDPEPLKEIAAELASGLPGPEPSRFDAIGKRLTAVDGSVVPTVVRVARLAWMPKGKGRQISAYRLHTQFEILRGLPERIDVTPGKPAGDHDERAVLATTLQSDHCYVMDRGYYKVALFNQIHAAGSGYICRTRDNIRPAFPQERELTDADRAAGVLRDREIRLGDVTAKDSSALADHPLRLIEIRVPPHVRTGSKGVDSDGVLRLVTNLMDVPAELIAEIYRLRWLIELFFRMFKQLLGCRHLLSTKKNGVEIQVYLAIIACILILMYTGKQPTKRTFEMICFYLMGWATLDDLEKHLEKLNSKAP